ncbi:MAG: serine protease [Acidimicrobiia bacterium]|nr:serine protease [Acidimicrobiia bacterium]
MQRYAGRGRPFGGLRLRTYAAACAAIAVAGISLSPVAGSAAEQSSTRRDIEPRVTNGLPAVAGDFPWYVALLFTSGSDFFQRQFCGGTVVAPKVVVTAAHCVDDLREVDVLYGTDLLDGSGTLVRSSSITVHPAWDPLASRNDIAVVKLSRSIPTAGVTLAGHDNEGSWEPGDRAKVVGFGCNNVNAGGSCLSYPHDLWRASLPLRSDSTCNGVFGGVFDPQTMLCAGTASPVGATAPDTCQGDSGGPLTTTGPGGAPILVGVVSWGYGCSVLPGVYARVATYEPWLAQFGLGDAGGGYWLAASDGGIFSFGDADFHGSTGGVPLVDPVVAMAPTPTRRGYWLAASDGGIFSFGDARFHGSTGGVSLVAPIVDMSPSPGGGGYWLAASDGGIFAFGDAEFHGSAARIALRMPIVTLASTAGGQGYWLAAADGGIFSFGDAQFFGSTGGIVLDQPVVDMAPTSDGRGYWLCAADGGVFAFGSARYHGSTGGMTLDRPIVDFTPTPTGGGYWLTARDGGVFAFGDAGYHGSTGGMVLDQPIVAAAAS